MTPDIPTRFSEDPALTCGALEPGQKISLCRLIADQLRQAAQHGAAEIYLLYAEKVAREASTKDLASIYLDLGAVLYQRSEWLRALHVYEKAWALVGKGGCFDEAAILNGIACQKYQMGSWDEAELLYKSTLESSRQGVGRYWAELNYAVLLGERGSTQAAIEIEDRLAGVLAHTNAEFEYYCVLSNLLYHHALRQECSKFEGLWEQLMTEVQRPNLRALRFGIVDTALEYAFLREDSSEAQRLLEELGLLLLRQDACYMASSTEWFAVREAMFLRCFGSAEQAVGRLQTALHEGVHWNALARARALYELALAAQTSGNGEVRSWSSRQALGMFQALRLTSEEIKRRQTILNVKTAARKSVLVSGATEFDAYLGRAEAIRYLKGVLARLARTESTLLLTGETGTGKTMLALEIHGVSRRRLRDFVRFDCTCNDEGLIESLLFGHQKGAFTGAVESRRGLVELARGGTLFIDEVAELPLSVQGKLLTLLEEGTYRPVGSSTTRKADVRFIVATNRDLEKEVQERRFREDLLYRLGNLKVELPPMRSHPEDVPVLIRRFLADLNVEHRQRKFIAVETLSRLQEYAWPGNVRQLKKALERAFLLSDGHEILLQDFGVAGLGESSKAPPIKTLEELERDHIRRVLSLVSGNKSKAARMLGMKRTTLYSRMEFLGLNDR